MRSASVPRGETVPLSRPKGGYLLIPAVRLAIAWWAYHQKLIRLVDLRLWFAAWEMRARRCRTPSPLPCRFGFDELQRLTGLSFKRIKASLRRLEDAGLLAWSQSDIAFPDAPRFLHRTDPDAFRQFLERIPNHRRLVPVPRRILRLLAGGARPALIATILGHLFRCLYLKGGRCLPAGRVKASWIADTFGIGLRRVKQARQELIALGWLIPLQSKQWALNRWGALIRINLGWSRLDGIEGDSQPAMGDRLAVESGVEGAASTPPAPATGPGLAPPPADSGPGLAPPDSDEEPLPGAKDQEPAPGGPAGFFLARPEERTPEPVAVTPSVGGAEIPQAAAITPASASPSPSGAPTSQPASVPRAARPVLGKPKLRDVVPEDLTDTGRLLELYEQAVRLGLVTPSEWDRLRFVAAAEHARMIGTRNPCGLFVRLVRGKLWHFATGEDEQSASVRLRRHLYGAARVGPGAAERPGIRTAPELSADARLVEAVRSAASRARYRGDAFPLLKRAQPEWTRERWDRAVAELGR